MNTLKFTSQTVNPENPEVLDVSPEEVLAKKDGVYLVDVRRPDEFTGELGHIEGAHLIVLDELPQCIDELPKDETLVFICRSGGRSARATAFAKQHGLDSVFNMKGGMLLWNEMGLPTETEVE